MESPKAREHEPPKSDMEPKLLGESRPQSLGIWFTTCLPTVGFLWRVLRSRAGLKSLKSGCPTMMGNRFPKGPLVFSIETKKALFTHPQRVLVWGSLQSPVSPMFLFSSTSRGQPPRGFSVFCVCLLLEMGPPFQGSLGTS